jgi:DNA-binding PadR family transcriptional regulator
MEHKCLSIHRNRAGYRHSGEKHTGLTNKIYILTAEGAENAEKYLAAPSKIGFAFNEAGLYRY